MDPENKGLSEFDPENKGVRGGGIPTSQKRDVGIPCTTIFVEKENVDPENKGLSEFDPENKGLTRLILKIKELPVSLQKNLKGAALAAPSLEEFSCFYFTDSAEIIGASEMLCFVEVGPWRG